MAVTYREEVSRIRIWKRLELSKQSPQLLKKVILKQRLRLLYAIDLEQRCEKRAERYGIPVLSFYPKSYDSKADFETFILQHLNDAGVEWIVLAGYMRLIGPTLFDAFEGKLLIFILLFFQLFLEKMRLDRHLKQG